MMEVSVAHLSKSSAKKTTGTRGSLVYALTQILQDPVRVFWRLIDIYTIRIKFPVGFCPRGSYKFCWLLIGLTRFYHKNSTWWDREIRQHMCSICCTIFKGWGQQHDGGFVGHYFHLITYTHTKWSCRWLTRLYYTRMSYKWKTTITIPNQEASHTWKLESPSAARWVMSLWHYMDGWVGVRIYLCNVPFIPKLKDIRLKSLPIDSHLGLAMVGAIPLLKRLAVHNTNSYTPTLDEPTSSCKARDNPLLQRPQLLLTSFN